MLKDRGSIRKSLFSLLTSQGVIYGVTLIQTPYLTRHLGPPAFGVFSFSNILLAISLSLIGYAANNTATYQFRKHAAIPTRRSLVFWNQVGAQIVISLLLSTALLAWTFLSVDMQKDSKVYGIVVLNFLLMGYYSPWLWASLERFQMMSALNVGSRLLSLALIILTVHGPNDAEWAVAAVVIPNLLSAVVFFSWIVRERIVLWIPPARWRPLAVLKKDFFIATSIYAVVLQSSVGILLAKSLLDEHDYGILSFADRFRALSAVVVGTIGGVLYSRFCGERIRGSERAAAFGQKSAFLLTGSGLAIGALLSVFSYWVVLVLGGKGFLAAIPLSYLVALMLPFVGLNYYLTFFVMNVFGLAKQQLISLVITAIAIAAALLLRKDVQPLYVMGVIVSGEIARSLLSCLLIYSAGFYVFRPGIARPLKTAA